jgi:DNA-binding transcriptional regulator YdaS (Cro superfamily)
MQLKPYLFSLTVDERDAFAKKVGCSAKHLQNVCYGLRKPAPEFCTAIERITGTVTRKELRPQDYHLIWPDLPKTKTQRKTA